ncbi:hypothetical protein Dimus_030802, partial [Dionaea muscipula]
STRPRGRKISRKKKSAASRVNTADVTDIERREVPSEGTVGNTQESEAVVEKGMTQPRPKRLRAKHVISPGVGNNLLEIIEVEEVEDEEDEMPQTRSRRVLPKQRLMEPNVRITRRPTRMKS